MRKLALALAMALLVSTGVLGGAVQTVAAASQAKVVIVVGATGSLTAGYRSSADSVASTFSKYTSNIVKVYSPSATWAAVQAATQGASVLVYIGHGSGYPNPYVGYLQPNGDNGMGLNSAAGAGDSNTKYYGENYMAQLGLASNAVVILWKLCYASGDEEWGAGTPTLSVAQTRVDGYASGFLRGNARAVIAEGLGSISPYIDALFTAHESIDQMWQNAPNFHNHVLAWASTRNSGYASEIDPQLDRPESDGDVYYRSMVSLPGLSTDDVGLVAPVPTIYAPTSYVPLTPTRILDTRNGNGAPGPLSSHVPWTFQVTGRGGVPANATAVTGNLTVTAQSSPGYLYIGPSAMSYPTNSTLNFPLGDDRANAVTVALGAGGTLSLTYVTSALGPTAHALFDVTGYFVPDTSGATYVALIPARFLDSRSGNGLSGAFNSHAARTFQVTGRGGVPANATAVTGNLTVTGQSSAGYLYVGPVAMNNPTSSTLNFPVGDDRANQVTVALGTGGTLSITFVAPSASQIAHAIFDVTGYFVPGTSGARYVPLTPSRLLDSRSGNGLSGPFASDVARTFQVSGRGGVSGNSVAVTGNLTVTSQTSPGYLYIGPGAVNNPTSSTLNFPKGDDRANGVAVALGAGGTLSITYAAPTSGPIAQVIFDVTGYFAP
jgi:serine protease inhibitor ecotin